MHILFVTHYYAPDSGAAANRLTQLASALAARGHAVTVLTTMPHYPKGVIAPDYRGKFTVIENRDGVRVIQVWLWATASPKISRKLLSQLSFMFTAFIRGFFLKRSDVVFVEAQPVFTGFAGALLSVMKRRSYVLNISDLWPDHLLAVGSLTERSPIYRTARWLVNTMYRGASQIIVLSPRWGDKIATYVGADEKITLIYNGIDLNRFHPALDTGDFRIRYNIPVDKKMIAFIGTFATQYDFPSMFAVSEALGAREDVVVVFCGTGSQRAVFDDWMRTRAPPNVIYTGWVNLSEIPVAWAATDIAFLAMHDASLYQGTVPAKLFEIFGSGVPLVAAIEGVASDIIAASEGGMTVDCGDRMGLISAINILLDDDVQRERLAHAARRYAESNFDFSHVVDRYESALYTITRR